MAVSNASAQLSAIGRELRSVADGRTLKRELTSGIRAAAAPLKTAVHDAALTQLPRRGGLNQQVASQRVTVSVLTGARTAGVRLKTTAPDTAQTDAGFVRHPVPKNRQKWVTQQIPAATGWWSRTLATRSPAVTPLVLAVMERVAVRIRAAGRG